MNHEFGYMIAALLTYRQPIRKRRPLLHPFLEPRYPQAALLIPASLEELLSSKLPNHYWTPGWSFSQHTRQHRVSYFLHTRLKKMAILPVAYIHPNERCIRNPDKTTRAPYAPPRAAMATNLQKRSEWTKGNFIHCLAHIPKSHWLTTSPPVIACPIRNVLHSD